MQSQLSTKNQLDLLSLFYQGRISLKSVCLLFWKGSYLFHKHYCFISHSCYHPVIYHCSTLECHPHKNVCFHIDSFHNGSASLARVCKLQAKWFTSRILFWKLLVHLMEGEYETYFPLSVCLDTYHASSSTVSYPSLHFLCQTQVSCWAKPQLYNLISLLSFQAHEYHMSNLNGRKTKKMCQ